MSENLQFNTPSQMDKQLSNTALSEIETKRYWRDFDIYHHGDLISSEQQ
jgi:hypothetical protein